MYGTHTHTLPTIYQRLQPQAIRYRKVKPNVQPSITGITMGKTAPSTQGNATLKASLKAGTYTPGMGNTAPASPAGNTAPAPAPVPAVATAPAVPVQRGAFYAPAPQGTTLIGNVAYVTVVQLCNLASLLPLGSVNYAVAKTGGNGGTVKPAPGMQCYTQGGRKLVSAASVQTMCQMLQYTGTVYPQMYYYRNLHGTAQLQNVKAGLPAGMQAIPAGLTPAQAIGWLAKQPVYKPAK